jgi:hypothetical protein
MKWILAAALSLPCLACASAPVLLHTANQEAPVRGAPGELLEIQGYGFKTTDRVVYETADVAEISGHPATVPPTSTAIRGLAPIVNRADPPYAITIQLPDVIAVDTPYRLWVVDRDGEWSDAVAINDPRPLWISPAAVYSSVDPAGLGRAVRVVGRNLNPRARSAGASWIRLQGPSTYDLAVAPNQQERRLAAFVRAGLLPRQMTPGRYAVSISDDGRNWLKVAGQQLEVRADPRPLPHLDMSETRFGSCKPDDGLDDSQCLTRALEAARVAGGAVITFASGTWDLDSGRAGDGFMVAPNVHLEGTVQGTTILRRHGAKQAPAPGALLTLSTLDSITGIAFTDDVHYGNPQESRGIIQLGRMSDGGESTSAAAATPDDVLVSRDSFLRVGRALSASGRPIHRLIVTHNVFGAFDTALMLTGAGADPFELEDSIIRDNRFVPGSYLDIAARQGTIASQIGASKRVDFSNNTADGAATEGLQDSHDPSGWRAAFFWSLANNNEDLLISDNQIDCSGDKAGDGEAISLDGNGGTYAFDGVQIVDAAGADWVRVRATPAHLRNGHTYPDGYFTGHWLTVVDGAGLGQTRKIQGYTEDRARGTTTFRVSPSWDLIPQVARARIVVTRQYWQVYVLANRINHASPPCHKSNLNLPRGGVIGLWTQIADSVVQGNEQHDSDGIEFLQAYNARVPSCPACENDVAFVTALEIRDNRVDGEYDWSSGCSWSGIRGYFVAAPTPESPPPWLGVGIVIADNEITHADGVRGGAIEIARAGQSGPAPGKWPIAQNILIYRNIIRDISGPAPREGCGQHQTVRSGIRIEGDENIRSTVLEGNRCEHVDVPLQDAGTATARICPTADGGSCECRRP